MFSVFFRNIIIMQIKNISLLTFIAAFLITGCGSSEKEKQQSPSQAQARQATLVKTQEVQLHNLDNILELPGTLEPDNIANVLSTTEGKITHMDARQGDKVSEGQLLAMLSPLLREDIINAARLNLIEKEQAYKQRSDNDSLRREMEQARSDYEFALKQYREIPVIAPVSGIISDRWVDMGDMIPARHKMFEIHSNTQLLVKVPVSELDIRLISVGQQATITSDACPEQVFRGIVQRIYPQVDRQSRNAMVEVLLPNPCPQLRSGMFVRTSFTTRSIKNAVAIPVSSVMERGQQHIVFIIEDQKAREVAVETGLQTDGLIEIVSGLEAGQILVVEGQEQLQTGRQVRTQQPRESSEKAGGNI